MFIGQEASTTVDFISATQFVADRMRSCKPTEALHHDSDHLSIVTTPDPWTATSPRQARPQKKRTDSRVPLDTLKRHLPIVDPVSSVQGLNGQA